ncbi:hypothetical protein HYU11_05990 [Candidatus Woesearchaeota archaeon]|nr:hypothetical protein [Candidatus Woesearchaeota archaeon]
MNNAYLTDQVRKSYLGKRCGIGLDAVIEAMEKVDRRKFIPAGLFTRVPVVTSEFEEVVMNAKKAIDAKEEKPFFKMAIVLMKHVESDLVFYNYCVEVRAMAYNDDVLPIGSGQTCSQPSLVAYMAVNLDLRPGMNVLEIGTGCGYHAAVTKEIIGNNGTFATVECISSLAMLAKKNLSGHFKSRLGTSRIEKLPDEVGGFLLVYGDGSEGFPALAPYDRIYLTAGVGPGFDPDILGRQLKPCGILLYPEKEGDLIKVIYEDGHTFFRESLGKVSFVPLVGKNS